MTTRQKVAVTTSWTLVYDASTDGPFTGAVCSIQQQPTIYRVAKSLPSAGDSGMTPLSWLTISLSQSKGEKLYARSVSGTAQILLDDSMGADANDADLNRKISSTIDILNQIQTAEYTPIVGQKPLPGLTFLRDLKVGGDSEFSVVGGEIRIDGGLGLRSLYTTDYGLYVPGLLGLAGLRTRMETPNTGTYRYGYGNIGGNSDTNRAGIEIVDGAESTFLESGGTRWYSKSRADWLDPLDGTGPSGITADINGATLRIVLGWYGGISILFTLLISDRVNGDRLVTIDSSGPRPNGVTLEQPDLPIFAEADGGVMYVDGRQYGVCGRFRPQYRATSTRKIIKDVGETLTPIVSMRHKPDSRWLSVPVKLDDPSVSCTVGAEYVVIIGGTLNENTFTSIDGIDPEETALEMNTAATTVTGGYRAPGDLILGGTGRQPGRAVADLPDISIPSGTVVTLAVVTDPGAGTGSSSSVMRMRELW